MVDIEASVRELAGAWGQGPGMHKRQSDLDRYEALIDRVKPAVVVETGLLYGGSQIWFSKRVPHHIAVELPDTEREPERQNTRDYYANRWGLGEPPSNGHLIEGNSHHVFPAVAAMARELAKGGPIMVVLDSAHDTETVYGEMCLYGELVTPGSYMIVEDGLHHFIPSRDGGETEVGNWYKGDPLIAIYRYLAENNDFVQDEEVQNLFPTTEHFGGWLKRRSVPRSVEICGAQNEWYPYPLSDVARRGRGPLFVTCQREAGHSLIGKGGPHMAMGPEGVLEWWAES